MAQEFKKKTQREVEVQAMSEDLKEHLQEARQENGELRKTLNNGK